MSSERGKGNKEKKKNEKIRKWMEKHSFFLSVMDDAAYESENGTWGPDHRLDSDLVEMMLKDFGLKPRFTAKDLLNVWSIGKGQ